MTQILIHDLKIESHEEVSAVYVRRDRPFASMRERLEREREKREREKQREKEKKSESE